MTAWTPLLAILALAAPDLPSAGPKWETDWKAAFQRARSENRIVFVDFWASWCGPCVEMDRRTFPDPRVTARLADFVLLKVDFDRSAMPRAYRISSIPMYVFLDPWENERFRFSGFHEAELFAQKLDLARRAAPGLIQAGRALEEKKTAQAFLLLGRSYMQARATIDAREAFKKAGKLAKSEGNAVVAQTAETQAALTWAMEGEAQKALKLLDKIAARPADAECEASVWIAIGHTRRSMKDTAGAAEAYRRAVAACEEGSPLRREAQSSLAALNP